MPTIERTVEIRAPLPMVWAFATDVRNHRTIVPPETREQVLVGEGAPLELGSPITFKAFYGVKWWELTSTITVFEPPGAKLRGRAFFRDEQMAGPFAFWRHDHEFEAAPCGTTKLTDRFIYVAPFGPIGRIVDRLWLNPVLTNLLLHMQTAAKQRLDITS